jgi:integrase/recombinase XerD
VRGYSAKLRFEIGAHALRATAATNALDHQAGIAKIQEWLGHANIPTTRIYDHRKTRPGDSPTSGVRDICSAHHPTVQGKMGYHIDIY